MNTITLKTLPQATAQQVFDQAARHLLTQGKKSKRGDDCAYRGDGGLKCVAGCFVADDEYSPRMENRSWRSLIYTKSVPSEHELLIDNLQVVHDSSEPDQWWSELYMLAMRENLSPAVLEEFTQ